jgi:glucose/arabinose dehydrogenase
MKKQYKTVLIAASLVASISVFANDSTRLAPGDIKVPAGFKATMIADNIGKARHIALTSNGNIYIKLANAKAGKGIVELKSGSTGKASVAAGFGDYGGTGMAIKNGYLYASSNTAIFRYKLDEKGEVVNKSKPDTIVEGLIDRGQHNSKSIALDDAGNIYVNIGAFSNSCQIEDRTAGSKGMDPCPILDSAGGIWQFKADKLNQTYGDGVRYATGIRNVVGLDWNSATNTLFVMQHGRDQLNMFPDLYNDEKSAELPAEEMLEIKQQGDNFGWPYCYFDPEQKKKVLAPEYGGDGKTEGRCSSVNPTVMGFPAHMAPNGLLFYTGNQFPERYKNGAFIAFHGSWNRAPLPQKGFFVAFVPFSNGKPSGDWEIFADNFAGMQTVTSTGAAKYRPTGLAQGPDGALYVTDDAKGTVWKITYATK